MISIPAPYDAELAKRVHNAYLKATWTTDASATTQKSITLAGTSPWVAYSHTQLRFEDLEYRARIPYLFEGLEFPSINTTVGFPKALASGNPYWFDYTSGLDADAIARRPMVGGTISLTGEIADPTSSYASVQFGVGVVTDIRMHGLPPRLELTATSGLESLTRRDVDETLLTGAWGGHSRTSPQNYIAELLTDHTFTDYCTTLVGGGSRAGTLSCQVRIAPTDGVGLADALNTLSYHYLASPFIDRLGQVRFYNWYPNPSRAADFTLTAADIVRDSGQLIPRLDRLATAFKVTCYNTYTLAPAYVTQGGGAYGGDGWFGTYRKREMRLDWYDDWAGDTCGTLIQACIQNAFGCVDGTYASVPTQFRCSVPYSVGLPLELGDCAAVKYEPAGLWGYSRWVVEEKAFRLASMTFDLIMHNRP